MSKIVTIFQVSYLIVGDDDEDRSLLPVVLAPFCHNMVVVPHQSLGLIDSLYKFWKNKVTSESVFGIEVSIIPTSFPCSFSLWTCSCIDIPINVHKSLVSAARFSSECPGSASDV